MEREQNRNFDTVEVHDGERRRTLTYDEFMAVPLDRRVGWLLTGRPRFFRGELEITKREALKLG